jgi:hypothetical protein
MTAPPLPGTEEAERAAQAETRLRVQALARERVGRLLLGGASGVGAGAGAVTGAGAGAMALEESYYGGAGGGGSGGGGGAGVDESLALSLYGADGDGVGDGAFDDSLILGRVSIEDAPPAPAETIITQPPPVLLGPGPETDLLLASGRVRVETGSAALAASVPLRRVAASALDWRELVPGLRLPEDGAAAASARGGGLIDAAGSTAGATGIVGDLAGVGRSTAAAAGFARIERPLLHPGRGVALPGADAPRAAHAPRAASAADLAAGPVSLRGDAAFIAQLDAHWARAPWQRAWDDADLESQVGRANAQPPPTAPSLQRAAAARRTSTFAYSHPPSALLPRPATTLQGGERAGLRLCACGCGRPWGKHSAFPAYSGGGWLRGHAAGLYKGSAEHVLAQVRSKSELYSAPMPAAL